MAKKAGTSLVTVEPIKPRTHRSVKPETCPHCHGELPPRVLTAKSVELRLLSLCRELERGAAAGDMRAASTATVLLRQLNMLKEERRKARRPAQANTGPHITIIDDLGHGDAHPNG